MNRKITLRQFNNGLSGLIIVIALYMIVAPFWPQLIFYFDNKFGTKTVPYSGGLSKDLNLPADNDSLPADNRLVIPASNINTPILEGDTIDVINSGGSWRRPFGSSPGEKGNTIIVAHRFYYGSSATFYHLDKLKIGDELAIYWQGKELVYEVENVQVVTPFATEVEAQTDDERLTLYTCTPLWTSINRLVVVAKPKKENI